MSNTRTTWAISTFSGNGYGLLLGGTASAAYLGDCRCGGTLDGEAHLAHIETGFHEETLDPVYGPAIYVCRGCSDTLRQWGRLRP